MQPVLMAFQRHHDPGTLAIASIGAGVIGGGIAAYGAYQKGKSEKAAYTYQAQVAQNNKTIADRNASYALARGETEAQIAGMKTRAQIGQTTAVQAASGLDVNSGSALDVRKSESEIGSFNEMVIRSDAAKQAYGYEVEGVNQQAQADVSTAAGKQASTAGDISALSSIVGGASSVSDKWMKYKTAGVDLGV